MNYGKYDYVEASISAGGLALFWSPFVKLTIVEMSTNYMECKVINVIGNEMKLMNEWMNDCRKLLTEQFEQIGCNFVKGDYADNAFVMLVDGP